MPSQADESAKAGTAAEVFLAFLKLGCTSFGGPIAHLGYFREELVVRRRWLDDRDYGELLALCQFLPGPASSQAGFALGLMRAGPLGGLAAWTAFTFPSAVLMFAFAFFTGILSGPLSDAALHGLKLAAVAIVAQALFGMARNLTPDTPRLILAIAVTIAMLLVATPAAQIAMIVFGALAGLIILRAPGMTPAENVGWMPGLRTGIVCLVLFAALLFLLPLAAMLGSPSLEQADIFYRAGALVFGGGHVVLPLLSAGLVPGWMNADTFLAGYGAAQALPGPLFAISAYLGAEAMPSARLGGALLALAMIFLPGMLLIAAALPFRAVVTGSARAQSAIAGANAAVVGILAAALYDPLWTATVVSLEDAAIAVAGFLLSVRFKVSPLIVIVGTIGAGWAITAFRT
ncbi:chromate transporter [Sphingobium sp. OAS761]|uniref:chromate efflux transporter n=1 Tax=Sphingobium sp. OAS761 TaxID=2817901 RepID=UPI0020A1349E|nr:chromate efflux transporter [Sphingobium sp. OAS761]MCP1469656.1 chromate transporter [Sphingobium sp. OAS761]